MGEENEEEAPREQLKKPEDGPKLRAWVEKHLELKLPQNSKKSEIKARVSALFRIILNKGIHYME